ncbi:hypothetical protein ACKWTF_014869 [Chironomus riparius]
MKLIITQILIVFALIALLECRKFTINKVYNEIVEGPRDDKNAKIFKLFKDDLNKDCVKDYLKLSQYGRLQVSQTEQSFLTKAAIPKCLPNNDEYFRQAIIAQGDDDMKDMADCYKSYLQKFEPSSPFVENFNPITNGSESEKCKKIIPYLPKYNQEVTEDIGSVEDFTCGAVTNAHDFIILIFKAMLLNSESLTEDVRKAESDKMASNFKRIVYATADCILKRIGEDHEERSLNNTLNERYNYEYELDSLDYPEGYKIPEDLIEARDKVTDMINGECVKQRLKLDTYGDIQLLHVEERIIYSSAKLKCLKTNLFEFSKLFINYLAKLNFVSKDYLPDSRFVLSKLEPSYALIKDYNGNSSISVDEYLAYFTEFRKPYFDFKDLAGTIEEATFGQFSKYDDIKFYLKLDLIAFEENEEVKMKELMNFVEEVAPKIHKIADGLIAKLT